MSRVLEAIWFLLKHTSKDHTLSIGIDLVLVSVLTSIVTEIEPCKVGLISHVTVAMWIAVS